jgi:hypothetical protein
MACRAELKGSDQGFEGPRDRYPYLTLTRNRKSRDVKKQFGISSTIKTKLPEPPGAAGATLFFT